MRAGIEGTNSALKRRHGMNRLKVRGLVKSQVVVGFKVAGISTKQQRMDSTMFMPNIKKSGRLALAYDVLVKGVKAIPEEMRCPALKEVLTSEFKTSAL